MVASGVILALKFPPLAAANNVWNERSITRNTLSRRAFINIGKSVSRRSWQPIVNSEIARYNTATRYRDRYTALTPGCGELSYSVFHFLPSRWIKLNAPTMKRHGEHARWWISSGGCIYWIRDMIREIYFYTIVSASRRLPERMLMETKKSVSQFLG